MNAWKGKKKEGFTKGKKELDGGNRSVCKKRNERGGLMTEKRTGKRAIGFEFLSGGVEKNTKRDCCKAPATNATKENPGGRSEDCSVTEKENRRRFCVKKWRPGGRETWHRYGKRANGLKLWK